MDLPTYLPNLPNNNILDSTMMPMPVNQTTGLNCLKSLALCSSVVVLACFFLSFFNLGEDQIV